MEYENIEQEIANLLDLSRENHSSVQSIAASRFIDYAASIILGRAIPDINDGLKPVHRRILQTMKDLHLSPSGAPKKSARIVGQALGLYHPHGDSSVYEAMVALAQPWTKQVPLIIGQGNFGSIDGDSPAAQRYTEAKLSKAGSIFFTDLDKDVVNLKDNYDSTEKEADVLPVTFPNLLINGGSGIAAGMATYIPSHNPLEVLKALKYVIRQKLHNREVKVEKIFELIPAPDFPTGGICYNTQNMLDIIKTGKGSIRLRAKYHIEKVNRKNAIIITEIPYQVVKTKLIKEIANLVKDKKTDMIHTIRDESSKEGIRVVIEVKNNIDPELLWNFLVKNSSLDISINYNMVVTKDKSPRESNIIEVLESFADFRKNIIERRYKYILSQAENRLEIVQGLLKALSNIDRVIEIIKSSKLEEDAINGLIQEFDLTNRQAKAILDMRIQKLIGIEKEKLEEENKKLQETIKEAKEIIVSDERKFNIAIEETNKVMKEIGFERRTEIDNSLSNIDMEDIIPKEDCVVYLSHKGYLRRIGVKEIEKQNRGTQGKKRIRLQEDDYLIKTFNTNSHSILLFITEKGKVYGLKAYKIPNIEKGRYIANILELDKDDKVINVVEVGEEFDDKKIIFATENGYVKMSKLSDYQGSMRVTGVIGLKLEEGDRVSFINIVDDLNKDLILISNQGKIIRFALNEISVIGRAGRGVIGMRDCKIIGGDIIQNDTDIIITVGERGTIKLTKSVDFRKQKRGGKGVLGMKISNKTGSLMKAIVIPEEKDYSIVLSSKNGITNKLDLSKIRTQSRVTAGIIGMKLSKDDIVVDAFTILNVDENNEQTEEE